jgi:hypothetical protein
MHPEMCCLPLDRPASPRIRSRTFRTLFALDKSFLSERVGKLSAAKLELVRAGIEVVLGR